MTKPNTETRVDKRDYIVLSRATGKRLQTFIVKNGVEYTINSLAEKVGVTGVTIDRRVRAMVDTWLELTDKKSWRTYGMLMPATSDCATDAVNWSAFFGRRDYTITTQVVTIGKRGRSGIALTYKGKTTNLVDLCEEHDIPYSTAVGRIQAGRVWSDVFTSSKLKTTPVVVDGAELLRVDERDYELVLKKAANGLPLKKMAVSIVHQGVVYSLTRLSESSGVARSVIVRRLKGLLSFAEVTSRERVSVKRAMPSIFDCLTNAVKWDLFVLGDGRTDQPAIKPEVDYIIEKFPTAKGGWFITYAGVRKSVTEWIEQYGVSYSFAHYRLNQELPFAEVFDLVDEERNVDKSPVYVQVGRFSILDKAAFLAGRSALFPAQNAGPLYCEVGGAV